MLLITLYIYLSYSPSSTQPPHSTPPLTPTPFPPAAAPPPFEGLLIKSDNSSFQSSKFSNTCPHDQLYRDCHDHNHFVSVIISFITLDIDIIILIIARINPYTLFEG